MGGLVAGKENREMITLSSLDEVDGSTKVDEGHVYSVGPRNYPIVGLDVTVQYLANAVQRLQVKEHPRGVLDSN